MIFGFLDEFILVMIRVLFKFVDESYIIIDIRLDNFKGR